jgi:hypothetical protein
MCSWDRFRAFAREPERRKVGIDARVQVEGVLYEVDPSLAGETVTVWLGLFDHELYVEHEERRLGPFGPIGGPIPLHRYRGFRKSASDERADRIEALADRLGLPRAALEDPRPMPALPAPPALPFTDPDPFQELRFATVIAAKLAIADYLGLPLAKLTVEDRRYIDTLLKETLDRRTVITCVRGYFREREHTSDKGGGEHAN